MQVITKKFRDIFVNYAENTAIVDYLNKTRYSYGDLEDLSSRTAYYFCQHVQRHDRVILLLSNSTEMVVSYLACVQAGLTSIPINPDFHEDEISAIVHASASALIVTDAQNVHKLSANLSQPIVQWGKTEPHIALAAMRSTARLDNDMFPHIEDDSLVHIVFSSGTTSMPKAIPIKFGRIIGHAAMFAKSHRLDPTCRFYNVLPLAYLGGWYNLTLVPFMCGGSAVLDRVFGTSSMYRYWSTILDNDINCIWCTPSMLSALLAIGIEDIEQAKAIKRQIQWAMVGMAPLLPELKAKFEKMFGLRLQQSYGLSETFLFTSWMSDTDLPDASVGKCLEGYDVKIAVNGEIKVRGDWIFDEYWHQEELTASVFDDDGYFQTGDAGYLDKNGNLYITGRLKDLIIRGGVNISPAEIENALCYIDGVKEAAVIGVSNDLYGEKIIAFVTSTISDLTEDIIINACRRSLSALKVPAAIHILRVMPLNASGKIDKKILKETLAHGYLNT